MFMWYSLVTHRSILLYSFRSQFGGPSVSASRELNAEDEELDPSSRYGLLPTLYWHLLTGPAGAYVRMFGDAAAWLTTIVGRKLQTIILHRGRRVRLIIKRWWRSNTSASNVKWYRFYIEASGCECTSCTYKPFNRGCTLRWYTSIHMYIIIMWQINWNSVYTSSIHFQFSSYSMVKFTQVQRLLSQSGPRWWEYITCFLGPWPDWC